MNLFTSYHTIASFLSGMWFTSEANELRKKNTQHLQSASQQTRVPTHSDAAPGRGRGSSRRSSPATAMSTKASRAGDRGTNGPAPRAEHRGAERAEGHSTAAAATTPPRQPPDEGQSGVQSLSFRCGGINTNLWLPSVPGKIFG